MPETPGTGQGDELATKLIKRFGTLKAERSTFEARWEEIARNIIPDRVGFLGTQQKGEDRDYNIFDGTAGRSLGILASALHGMMNNPSLPWFGLKITPKKTGGLNSVKTWLEKIVDLMREKLADSNFYTEIDKLYLDLGSLATACMYSEVVDGKLRFACHHMKEIYIVEDYQGIIDTVFRHYVMTARQAIQEFGKEKLSEKIEKAYEKKPETTFEFLHCVFPREEREPRKKDSKNMPFASIYLEFKAKKFISEGGYEEMPFSVVRWRNMSGETYGRGPGWTALADTKMLQEMCETTITSAQRLTGPAWLVADESIIGDIHADPDEVTYYDDTKTIPKAFPSGEPQIGLEMENQRREAIREDFLNDQLQLVGGPDMTATEVTIREHKKQTLIGPTFGRLVRELFSPIIERVFNLMARKMGDEMPVRPAVLNMKKGQKATRYVVEYLSPIARAQKAEQAAGILQTFEPVTALAEAKPDIWDNFDLDKAAQILGDFFGMPNEIKRTPEEIAKLREDRAKAAQAEKEKMEQDRALAQADVIAGTTEKMASAQGMAGGAQ